MSVPGRCHYCREPRSGVTKDHIVPRALGGPNAVWNLVRACALCNGAKADSWPDCQCNTCRAARIKFRQLVKTGKIIPKRRKIKHIKPEEEFISEDGIRTSA